MISSCHPPLGVMAKLLPDVGVSVKSVVDDDNIVMISDGIIEARNSLGEMFEQHRFESAIIEGAKQGGIANYLMAQVSEFFQQVPQEDDLSIIELPCGGWGKRERSRCI